MVGSGSEDRSVGQAKGIANEGVWKEYAELALFSHRKLTVLKRLHRLSSEQRDAYEARLEKHYMSGTWYGQSASNTVYFLATVLERVDNDFLWYDSRVGRFSA